MIETISYILKGGVQNKKKLNTFLIRLQFIYKFEIVSNKNKIKVTEKNCVFRKFNVQTKSGANPTNNGSPLLWPYNISSRQYNF